MKLYVYDHCPFCVRARMIFGLKNLALGEIENRRQKISINLG